MSPSMEPVIWLMIMFLNEPETATKTRTKMTPMAMREAVSSVLRL